MANEVRIKFIPDGNEELVNAIKKLSQVSKELTNEQQKQFKSGKKVSQQFKNLDVKLKGLDSSMSKAGVSGKLLTKAMQGNRVALEKTKIAVNKHIRALKGLGERTGFANARTRILGGTLAVVRSKLLLFNFAVGFAIRGLSRFAGQASKVESMENAFITLAGAGESSRVALQRLQQATNNTMSEFDLFQQANNAMVLGVSQNSEEMAEMFDIAQRLGRALGRDTASSVESLVTGIGRQSRLMLDNIGIIVKSEEAYENYAKKIGISVEQLTDQEKKTAFLESAMESARAKVKTLGDEVFTNQDVYDKLTTATSNLATETGQFLQPALTTIAKKFTKVAESAGSYFKSINLANEPIKESMTNEEKLERLVAKRLKQQAILNTFVSGRGVASQSAYNDQSQIVFELGQKILFIMSLINQEREKEVKLLDESENSDKKKNDGIDRRVQIQQQELKILQQKNIDLKNGISIEEQLNAIVEQRELLRLQMLNKDISEQEFKKKNLELTGKEITLEEKKKKVTLESAGATLQALSSVASQSLKNAQLAKDLALAGAFIDMFAGMNKAFQQEGILGFLSGTAIFAQGMANISQIQAQKFKEGGLVGGRLHSQGGTMIEAERGEFVMSRNAVESIGLENLNSMNQGQSPITLNISAPLVDETVVDTIIPAIEKAQRMNLA